MDLERTEYEAVRRWARAHGYRWKMALQVAWGRADYPGASPEDGAILQRLRNTRGHRWVAYFSLEERDGA